MAIHIQDRYIVKKMVSGYMLFVLLFVVLLLLPLCILCKPAVMAKKTHLTVYKGQDVNFLVTTHNPIIYAHFGEAKEGSYHYPFLLVFHVDKSNVVTLATNTSYSSRMEFKGNLTDGQVLFKLSHTQLSDSGEYLIYMKESDKAPDAVTFVLTVKGPLTSTPTHTTGSNNWDDNAGSDSSEPVPTTTPVKTANTTSSPTQADNQPIATGVKIIVGVVVSLVLVVIILCIIYRRKIMNWWRQQFGQRKPTDAEDTELESEPEQKDNAFELDVSVATDGKLLSNLEELLVKTEEERGGEAL